MWLGIFFALVGLILGTAIGLNVPLVFPQAYGKYIGLAVLAALDSVFGGIRASMEDRFDDVIFLSGFFANALLAAGLVFLGDRLGVELYTAAIVAFGVRLFQNLGVIRRHLLKK
ncbi:small basic family protein [Thermodesulfitimonas autotrophica]|jgi:small basic protein|uniref:Small basic protein n=1 Tax=Thermodesulfitimonas autotrophica TaxID=1894989 RepID=A0A3N5API7_9THEO|nr:small basic family protein [Thermodesulfitimonas autotrophica]RPF46774.1 small basic protein [Thermodesulfitimonas autotrophica]